MATVATEEHMAFLDALREDGSINMYAAAPSLREEFPGLDKLAAREILKQWMDADRD